MAKKQKLSKLGSTNVADFRYNPKTQTMDVEFVRRYGQNAAYRYYDVEPETVRGLERAKSKGRYMNGIAYSYDYRLLR